MCVDIVALGEPLVELNSVDGASLRDARHFELGFGGDTANFCVAASRLGARAGYLCRLGADEFGQIFLDLWSKEGVDASQVIVEAEAATGIYFVARQGGAHTFTYYRKDSAACHYAIRDLPGEYIRGAKVLHTSGITQAISACACDAAFAAMDLARQAGVLVSYDPNVRLRLWNRHRARAVVFESMRMADFVFPSLEDAQVITGREDPQGIVEMILDWGPKVVALKLGGQGVLLATAQERLHVAPHAVQVVDTTGAGDTFAGAFVAAYLQRKSFADCARFANAAAALSTTGWGAVNSIPRDNEVEAFLKME